MAQNMMADGNYRHQERISDEAERCSGQEKHRIEKAEAKVAPIAEGLKEEDEAMEEIEEIERRHS